MEVKCIYRILLNFSNIISQNQLSNSNIIDNQSFSLMKTNHIKSVQFLSSTSNDCSNSTKPKSKIKNNKHNHNSDINKKYLDYAYSNRRIPEVTKKNMFDDLQQNLKQYNSTQIPYLYFQDIYHNMKSRQYKAVIDSNFLDKIVILDQNSKVISNYSKKRHSYVSKLCSIHNTLERSNSIWLCINLFDRLNEMVCKKNKKNTIFLKDIHINTYVSLRISGKFCQIYPESLYDLFELLGMESDTNSIHQREMEIFQQLKWNFNIVSEWDFYSMFTYLGNMSEKDFIYGLYMLHLGLSNLQLCSQKPSVKAAAVISILCKNELKRQDMDLYYIVGALTEIKSQDLQRVRRIYCEVVQKQNRKPGIIYKLFSTPDYMCVSKRRIQLQCI